MTSHNVPEFLLQADTIIRDARFTINSFPNAEGVTVERILRHLYTILHVLESLDDPFLTQQEIDGLIATVTALIYPMEEFLELPPMTTCIPPPIYADGPGRPRYSIDLQRALDLHSMGNSWSDISLAMGVDRKTMYRHLRAAGIVHTQPIYSEIHDDDLDEKVSTISSCHPLAGCKIVQGHLAAMEIQVPVKRVMESLRRVDAMGAILRWRGIIKRRVYKVRGSNALWHHDGNEKLKPWGFYIHGCIDGYSRLIIYLVCVNNKRAKTVEQIFLKATSIHGWPSRVRGDCGTENNGVERQMIGRWGEAHRAYLRGRSLHNIRIERLWRDVRRDTLEFFRQIFFHLEEVGLLNMESKIHRLCLYLVFQPRIQRSLDETISSWNLHRIRTERNKSPIALFELSRERAINGGYWTGDPGDDITDVNDEYGIDNGMHPPQDELANDPEIPNLEDMNREREWEEGVYINDDEEIAMAKEVLDLDVSQDDGNWGIDIYCQAVLKATEIILTSSNE